MVKRTFLPLGILLLILAFCPLQAQDYQQYAGGLSTLYRGRMQNMYPYRFNGTYYLQTRKFGTGSVQYNGKRYDNVLLNLDAYSQELVTKPTENAGTVVLFRDQVAWFTLGDRRFVNLRYMGYKEAEEGYYEVLRDGKEPLLRLNRKFFRTEIQNRETPEMDGNFDPEVVNTFLPVHTDYVLEGSRLKKLSRRALARRMKQADNGVSPFAGLINRWHPAAEDVADGTLPAAGAVPKGIGLPDGYFKQIKEDTTTVQHAQNVLTATYRNKIYTIGTAGRPSSGKATVSGVILEAETGEPLPGVVVYDDNTSTYARSNARGEYRISLPTGSNVLNFNADSKEELALKLEIMGHGSLDVVMTEKVNLLKGAIISAESMRQHRSTTMGVESVSMNTIGKIPSAFGEGDIIKAVLTLPGVKSVGEASGGFNVRGGSADQNLILYNDNTIYNPSHLFGIFSAFNPDLTDNVELYKSSIPAEYGGRISSVLRIRSKEGDPSRVRGSIGLGLLTSRMHLEGPLRKGKTTFIAGGRITYSDWMLKLLPKHSAYTGGGASFWDANLGLTHRFNDHNSLQLFGYYAADRFSFSGDTTFRYNNLNASAVYRHKSDDGSSFRISAGYDQYLNTLGAHNWESGAYDLSTHIRQAFLKIVRVRVAGSHTITYGVDATGYALDPGIMEPFGENSQIKAATLNREYGLEPALHLEDNWAISEIFSIDGGVRLSSFYVPDPSKFYIGPEVRVSAKFSPAKNFTMKAGYNTMRQYIHLISNTSSVSPMDTWRLTSAEIAPTTGWQGAGGIYWTLLGAGLDFSLEGYYKESQYGLDYKSGATLSMNPHLSDELVPVQGKAYGVEFMLKKPAGALTGWISYNYSRSLLKEMQDRGKETINGGEWYNAPYDKPHEFKLVANWAMTHRFSLSLNVDYSTGRPITVPIGKYWYGGDWRLAYSDRNSYRIPDYFRMDAAFNIDPGHYKKSLVHASFTIGVYNITGRKNPYSVFFRTNQQGQLNGYMLSIFATQIPYINLNLLF